MEKNKFSPGPWRWDTDWLLLSAETSVIAEATAGATDTDARLIAAAPEMYRLLREMATLTPWPEARALLAHIDGEE